MPKVKEEDPFDVLELRDTATLNEIKAKYRELAQDLHSDIHEDTDEDQLKKINVAYETLTVPEKRKVYDKQKARERQAAGSTTYGGHTGSQPGKNWPPYGGRPANSNRSAASSFEEHVAQRVEELRSLPTRPDRSALQAKLKRVLVVLAYNVLVELVLVFGVPDLFFHAFAHWQAALFDFVDEGSYLRKTIAGVIAGWMVLPAILIGSCALTLQGFAAKDWTARVGGYVGALIAGFFWGIQAVALVSMGHTVRGFWS